MFFEGGTNAAKVRVFDVGVLSPKEAAQAAIADKASIVLGPITANTTREISTILLTAGIPELSFTSDVREGKPKTWAMGLTAKQQTDRLLAGLKAKGQVNIAAFLPSNDFGHAFGDALIDSCKKNNFSAPQIAYHDGSPEHIAQGLQELAKTQERHEQLDKAKENPDSAAETSGAHLPPPPFQALLLADTGVNLRNIISDLPDSGISLSEVQLMGPALWRAFDAKLSTVQGAWYAAPNEDKRGSYVAQYEKTYRQKPLILTDTAYDVAVLTRKLQAENTLSAQTLLNPQGFEGINGHFRFLPNGTVDRDLGLYQILPGGGAKLLSPDQLPQPSSPIPEETAKTIQNGPAPTSAPIPQKTP